MRSFLRRGLLLSGLGFMALTSQAQTAAVNKADSVSLRKIYDEALLRGQSYENLRYLTGQIGGRLSGSPQAEQAVQWGKTTMEKLGLDRVYLQEVMVPHWVRGAKEKAEIKPEKGKGVEMNVCALGAPWAPTASSKPRWWR
ncbi:hypothetical protein [Hymenobacter cellulosilyticus]|uniref:hypothetical protein n=1 Tax=Hymenobacter cellulosilyticus TaxID=2932248 RepID=UPI0028807FB5|nr:hypothetical protein [Hymenobacter cellulosilyticus]